MPTLAVGMFFPEIYMPTASVGMAPVLFQRAVRAQEGQSPEPPGSGG